MWLKKDISNQRFGRLITIGFTHLSKNNRAMWNCICDCGNKIHAASSYLILGRIKSCGCLAKEHMRSLNKGRSPINKLGYGLARARSLYSKYKNTAKRKRLSFSISFEEFYRITQSNCIYCGINPLQIEKAGSRQNGNYIYNGIDRIDSNKGYDIDNCEPACLTCNMAKGDMSKNTFLEWIKSIYEYSYNINKESDRKVPWRSMLSKRKNLKILKN